MKHLDPLQIDAPTKQRFGAKRALFFSIALLALVFGVGTIGSALFPPLVEDMVSAQEKHDRQLAFTRIRQLHVAEIKPDQVNPALDEMRLPPSERTELLERLPQPSSGEPGTTAVPTSMKDPPLHLVSISVWDSHAEDGDVVTISSAGYRREIALTKAPQTVSFPVDRLSAVDVLGVKDGGGGITLGIRGPSQDILMPIMSEGQVLSLPISY